MNSQNKSISVEVLRALSSADLKRVRAPGIAESLGMSDSTFRRRMRAEGLSFSVMLEDYKKQKALRMLEDDPGIGGKQMFEELGYNELNSFYRAFFGWTGLNFREYKRRLNHEQAKA